jgi:hypothetical protein
MCIAAAPILGAVLSIAQAGAGYAAASKQAKEQNAYFEQNRQASLAAMRDRYASIGNNTLQQREAATMDLMEKQREALIARSKAYAAAGEGGVTGLSVNALWNDYKAQEARRAAAVLTNYNIKKQANEDEGISTFHNTISRINSVRQASKPSAAGFILQGIGGAAGAFSKTG